MLVIASPSISKYDYFGITKVVYGQSVPDQTNTNSTNSLNLEDIPVEKVHVGDIDIAYKTFGKGEPILLIYGLGGNMSNWEPSILRNLSTNHTVIVFDKRGIGNTTVGTSTNPFSIQQTANDTAGLLEALKIQKADILGYSQGSFNAQQLAVTHPEKINRLILVAAACGGKQSDSLKSHFSRDVDRRFSEIFNSSTDNVSLTRQDLIDSMNMSEGSAWLKSHPNLLQGIPERQNVNVSDVHMKYSAAGQAWMSPNWSGVCDKLTRISSPTLIIAGTDDNAIAPANSLLIASKIPGAWSVHIKDAGHSIMNQYPAEVAEILNTFLSTTSPNI